MSSLLTLADALYALAPGEFTAARDAAAKEHKADRELAAAIKALRKPALSAWVVDLLVRRETAQVEQVLAVGESLREAAAALDGDELRALTRQRRQLTAAVTSLARSTAAQEGVRVTDTVAEQVEATLTAAILDTEAARAVRSGLLVAPLSATGVGAVDVSAAVALPEALGFSAIPRTAPEPARPELTVVPDPEPDETARREAEAALSEAERALAEAEASATAARADTERHRATSLRLQAEMEELRGRLAELEDEADETDALLDQAESVLLDAEDEVAAAESARERARRALESLDQD